MLATTTPSRTSASTFRSVCDTSVPTSTGSVSRIRPSRRATISARDGSPSRAGSVADISTPIIVPLRITRRLIRLPGSAALTIACHETARSTIESENRASATSTQLGLERTSVAKHPVGFDVLKRQQREQRRRRAPRGRARARRADAAEPRAA